MKLRGVVAPPELSPAGWRIPCVVVRIVFAIAGAVLSLVAYGPTGWWVVGIVLSVAVAWSPQYLLGWGLILFLAASRLAHHSGLSWQFLVLLAGLHLLHLLALQMLELPWRGWAQLAVFIPPLRRFVAIQVPTQLLAVLALVLLAPSRGGHGRFVVAGFAMVGAVALAGVALLLTAHRLDERA